MTFGQYLRLQRTSRDWTLSDLADKIGMSLSYMSDIERGRRLPSRHVIDLIASFTDFKSDYLYYLAGYMPTDIWQAEMAEHEVSKSIDSLRE